MNIFGTAACRLFQKALFCALPVLPYRKPVILSSLGQLPKAFARQNCYRPLIITDPFLYQAGMTKALEDLFPDAIVYAKTAANPTSDNVEEAALLYQKTRRDSLIAIGGGSSMDCAKGVGCRLVHPHKPLKKMKGILKIHKKLPFLAAIPTTAGTGSETTLAAVITDANTRYKYAISDFPLIPAIAVLDPALTMSLPPALTAQTGMDALTHAIEAYIGQSTTKTTRAQSLDAISLIFTNLEQAYFNGENYGARQAMLEAAFKAGCAFTVSYVGYVHAIAHSLGGQYNLPHGQTNAIILPWMLEWYGPAIHEKLKELAIATRMASESDSAACASALFIARIRELNRTFGIPESIPEIKAKDIPYLASLASKEANPLYPVPVLMNRSELEECYWKLAGLQKPQEQPVTSKQQLAY